MTTVLGSGSSASSIGFEGYEKRLEISFSGLSRACGSMGRTLRELSRSELDLMLDAACCTIVDQLSNDEFDSYILSESSLFVYPLKIILKTCGTTKLLNSIPVIIELSKGLSLSVSAVKYSRGCFIFPEAQPAPHSSFTDEVCLLDSYFGNLSSSGQMYVLSDPVDPRRKWHVYAACDVVKQPVCVTLEMCMTELDHERATMFYKKPGSSKEMTRRSGISDLLPGFEICDFEFEPCGYSMNAIAGSALSTIHVTPQDGYSYASYEVVCFESSGIDYHALVERVLKCFQPSRFSVAMTCFGGFHWGSPWAEKLTSCSIGYDSRDVIVQGLPGGGVLMYQCFVLDSRMGCGGSPRSILLSSWDDEPDSAESDDDSWVLKEPSGLVPVLLCSGGSKGLL